MKQATTWRPIITANETKQSAIASLKAGILAGDSILAVKRSQSEDGLYRTYDVYRTSMYGGTAMLTPLMITQTICAGLGFRFDAKKDALGFGGPQGFREVLANRISEVIGVSVHVSLV